MVRVVLLVGIALALVMQVSASTDIAAIKGRVLQQNIFSNKLTPPLELKNSTDNSYNRCLNSDCFLGPDSKVNLTLQTAIQKVEELETAPTCDQMATAVLVHTCKTFKGDGEAHETTKKILYDEKVLFATRLAMCELSHANDRSLIPADCASFVPTETNTKKKGWLRYVFTNDHEKPTSQHSEYDKTTTEDCAKCVRALHQTSQTWSSFSNALQNANEYCSAVRQDIEKEELLKMHRAAADIGILQNDALRSQADTLYQQKEAMHFLNTQLLKNAQVYTESHKEFQQMLSDNQERLQALTGSIEVRLQAQDTALEEYDSRFRTMLEEWGAAAQLALSKHNTAVALAQSHNDEISRERIEYAGEMFQQEVLQIIYNASSTSKELAIDASNARQELEQINHLVFNNGKTATALDQTLSGATISMQQVQDQINSTQNDLAVLESQVLAISGHISAIVGAVIGILDRFPAVAWCFYYVVAVAVLLLVKICGGGPILRRAIMSALKLVLVTSLSAFRSLCKVIKRPVCAMGQHVDTKWGVLLVFAGLTLAICLFYGGSPIARSQQSSFSTLECIFLVMNAVFIMTFGVITASLTLKHWMCDGPEDEPEVEIMAAHKVTGFWFNDPKSYNNKECAV